MALSTKIKNIGKSVKLNPEFEKLPLKKLFVSSFFISVFAIIFGLLSQFILPPEIPLYYGLPQTTEQLAPSIFIILPSLISIAITVLNAVFSIKSHDNYLKRALAFASISIAILSIITTTKIVFLVGLI